MNLYSKIKGGFSSFSKWFKIFYIVMFVVYLCLWVYTIDLSNFQQASGIKPILPSSAKDADEYYLMSESLIHDGSLSMNGVIETLRTPGYPIFAAILRVMGGTYFMVTLVQVFLVFATAFIVRRIGIFFSERRVGEVASALILVNPVTMTLALLILTDVLFMFLFTLGFYLCITVNEEKPYKKILIASAIFAYSIYVRSMGIFVIPIFLVPILASKTPLKLQLKLMAFVAGFIILSTIPWIIRNYYVAGVAKFNSLESVGLAWTVPKFLSTVNGTKEDDESLAFQRAAGIPDELWGSRAFYDIRYSSQIDKVAFKIILEHPFSYAKFTAVSSIPFLFPSSILFMRDSYESAIGQKRPFQPGIINALAVGDWKSFGSGLISVWWKFAERLVWLFGYFLSLFVIWKDRRKPLVWIFIFIIAYLMFFSGPAAGPRLAFQVWPFMFVMFIQGWFYFISELKSFKRKGRGISSEFSA